jgi:hypothetical protein
MLRLIRSPFPRESFDVGIYPLKDLFRLHITRQLDCPERRPYAKRADKFTDGMLKTRFGSCAPAPVV